MVVDTVHEISTDAESAPPGTEAKRTVERRLRVRYVFAKAEGRWWIAGLQETEVKEAACSREQGAAPTALIPIWRPDAS
jgi:hypothetical protein